VRWEYAVEGNTNGFVDWGPLVRGGVVYTPNGGNQLLALDAHTGALLWQVPLISNVFGLTFDARGRFMVTTAITTGSTPTLFRLDPRTGQTLWDNLAHDQPAIGGIEAGPAVEDGVAYVGYLRFAGAGGVAAYDAESGSLLWHWRKEGYSAISPVAAGGGRIVVGFDDRMVYGLRARDGQVAWQVGPLDDLPVMPPVIAGKEVYIGAGHTLQVVHLASGQIRWRQDLPHKLGMASPAVSERYTYLPTEDGQVYALHRKDGSVLWHIALGGGKLSSSPILDARHQRLFLGSEANTLFVLDAETGKVLDQVVFPQHPSGHWRNSPALAGGWVYIGSVNRRLYGLGPADALE
jgi:outer membrane protein assembly factor BamB